MQLLHKTICEECAFYIKLECTHPDELGVNCATVTFCNSFTPAVEIDSPCVSFGNDTDISLWEAEREFIAQIKTRPVQAGGRDWKREDLYER